MYFKKYLIIPISCVALFLTCVAFSENDVCTWSPAHVECGQGTLPSLDVKGTAFLDQTNIMGKTHVVGSLQANHASLNVLFVTGTTSLSDTQVSGCTKMTGSLLAKNSIFKNKITVTSDDTTFDHSSTVDIDVLKNNHSEIVYLKNNSRVAGSVTFESNNGIVMLSSDSKISGSVIGGRIVRN